ncbi:hypothetical protein FB451DRAFT_1189280 [Mycena latifolia]|nr:hypothetical protein FB451DRAFT_1189280 [Mycena latifolia]
MPPPTSPAAVFPGLDPGTTFLPSLPPTIGDRIGRLSPADSVWIKRACTHRIYILRPASVIGVLSARAYLDVLAGAHLEGAGVQNGIGLPACTLKASPAFTHLRVSALEPGDPTRRNKITPCGIEFQMRCTLKPGGGDRPPYPVAGSNPDFTLNLNLLGNGSWDLVAIQQPFWEGVWRKLDREYFKDAKFELPRIASQILEEEKLTKRAFRGVLILWDAAPG